MTGTELALVGLALNGAIVPVIAWSMWRIRRAVSPEAAEFRRRLAETPFPQPIGFQALHEAHHSIGQTVDRYQRGDLTADEAMAEIYEQVGDADAEPTAPGEMTEDGRHRFYSKLTSAGALRFVRLVLAHHPAVFDEAAARIEDEGGAR